MDNGVQRHYFVKMYKRSQIWAKNGQNDQKGKNPSKMQNFQNFGQFCLFCGHFDFFGQFGQNGWFGSTYDVTDRKYVTFSHSGQIV